MRLLALLVLVACPKQAPAPTGPDQPEEPDLRPTMQEHFAMAARARDAVVLGDLAGSKKAFASLAALDDSQLVASWPVNAQALRERAIEGSKAESLESAALAVAAVAQACGYCHEQEEAGPQFPPADPPPLGKDVTDRMQRHLWATNRMWQAMVQPSAERFDDAARVLADAPLWRTGDVDSEELPAPVRPMEAHVRQIASQAHEAPETRVTAYGELLATCASCHAIAREPAP